jgi:excisionase family DNA binding protein
VIQTELLTTEEVAKIFKLKEKTVYEWARLGKIPSVQVVAGSNPVTPTKIKPCKSLINNGLQGFFILCSKLKPSLLMPP